MSTSPVADVSLAEMTYPVPNGTISPEITALIPSRSAISSAIDSSMRVILASCMRARLSFSRAGSTSRMTGDCERLTRKSSVTVDPSVVSAVRLSSSARTSGSRSAIAPVDMSVPAGPMPSARVAI